MAKAGRPITIKPEDAARRICEKCRWMRVDVEHGKPLRCICIKAHSLGSAQDCPDYRDTSRPSGIERGGLLGPA